MTPRETLEKYGLKTDVKSIRERVLFTDDFGEPSTALYRQQLWKLNGFHSSQIVSECHSADLTLLCELAEKGERAKYIEGELDDAKQDIIALTDKITRLREDVRYYRDVAYPRNPSGE